MWNFFHKINSSTIPLNSFMYRIVNLYLVDIKYQVGSRMLSVFEIREDHTLLICQGLFPRTMFFGFKRVHRNKTVFLQLCCNLDCNVISNHTESSNLNNPWWTLLLLDLHILGSIKLHYIYQCAYSHFPIQLKIDDFLKLLAEIMLTYIAKNISWKHNSYLEVKLRIFEYQFNSLE